MSTVKECTEPAHRRSLNNILGFLEEYHPVSSEKLSLVTTLRDRIRKNPQKEDLMDLANAIQDTDFALRRGVVKTLPGLASRTLKYAQEMEQSTAGA